MSFIIIYFVQNKGTIKMETTSNTKFSEIAQRYICQAGIENENPKFSYHKQILSLETHKTLNELKIHDQDKIEVILKKNEINKKSQYFINIFFIRLNYFK